MPWNLLTGMNERAAAMGISRIEITSANRGKYILLEVLFICPATHGEIYILLFLFHFGYICKVPVVSLNKS